MSGFDVLSDRTLKVDYEGDTRRTKLHVPAGATAAEAFMAINATVASMFGLQEISTASKLLYADDEGDLCTLTEHTVIDLALVAPEGVLRLTLKGVGDSKPNGEKAAAAMQTEPARRANVEHGENSAQDVNMESSPCEDTEQNQVREKLKAFSQRLDPNMKAMIKSIVQGMDPTILQNWIGVALGYLKNCGEGARASEVQADQTGEKSDGVNAGCGEAKAKEYHSLLSALHNMEAHALQALVLNVLDDSTTSGEGTSHATAGSPIPPNFMASLLQGLIGGKGCGKGGHVGSPASGEDVSGSPANGERGYEGSPASDSQAATAGGQQPFVHPMQMLFQALGSKGQGKGGCASDAPAGSPPPLNALFQAFAGKGQCKGGSMPDVPAANQAPVNPLQSLFGAILKGKGCGKGGTAMPDTSASAAPTPVAETSEARAAFDQSVSDLMEMGLVSDPQVARELLTQHGDISTVVSVLAEAEQ